MYAFDRTAGPKHERARGLVDRLDDQGSGAASVQVLQELFVTLTRKVTPPLTFDVARQIVADLLTWRIVEPTAADVFHAIDKAGRWQISFWDAMLLTTAERAGTDVLWSEDLSHGQSYGSVTVRNPFHESVS